MCRLNKSIYGLRQSSRQWFTKFSQALTGCNFVQSKNDYSLFTSGSSPHFVAILVYVDDIVVAGPSLEMIQRVQKKIQSLFKLKLLGSLRYFLGLEIAKAHDGISLSIPKGSTHYHYLVILVSLIVNQQLFLWIPILNSVPLMVTLYLRHLNTEDL